MKNGYSGEAFLDVMFKDLYRSDEVQHTSNPSDRKEEAIHKYMERLERVHEKAARFGRLDLVKSLYFEKYVIKKENIPSIYTEEQKEIIISSQEKRISMWLDYLTDENTMYPMWAKYWVFQGMLRLGTFDIGNEVYQRRSEKTVSPFIEPNPSVIANCIQNMMDYEEKKRKGLDISDLPVKSGSFKKIYEYFEKKFIEEQKSSFNSLDGRWVKYNQGSEEDAKKLCASLQGKGLKWCVTSEDMAKTYVCGHRHLGNQGGDFYVYYTMDEHGDYTIPRIAISMFGKIRIREIRGILDGQCLEEEMISALETKLKEMDFVSKEDLDSNLEKVNDQRKLVEIYKKTINRIPLTEEEIILLYTKQIGFGWTNDPLVEKTTKLRNFTEDVDSLSVDNQINVIIKNANKLPKDLSINNKETALVVVSQIGKLFQYLSKELKDDEQLVKTALATSPNMLEFVGERFKNNKTIVMDIVSKKGSLLRYASDGLKNDREVILIAIKNDGLALKYVGDKFKDDDEIVRIAITQNGLALEFAGEKFRKDKNMAIIAVGNGAALEYVSEELKKDKEIVLKSISRNGYYIVYANKELLNDKAFVIKLIHTNPEVFVYLREDLKKDKEIVTEAIMTNVRTFEYISKELKEDEKFIMELLSKRPSLISELPDKYRNNRELAKELVTSSSYAFKGLSKELQGDKEIVTLAVMKSYGESSLKYASEELKKDKSFIISLVSKKGSILEYVDDEFKKDKDVVTAAVIAPYSGCTLQYASEELKKDKNFIVSLVSKKGSILEYVDDEFKKDKDVVVSAIANDPYALKYASEEIKSDKEFIISVGAKYDVPSFEMSDEIQEDKKFMKKFRYNVAKEDVKKRVVVKVKQLKEASSKLVHKAIGCLLPDYLKMTTQENKIDSSEEDRSR